jgi:hypothetical protein
MEFVCFVCSEIREECTGFLPELKKLFCLVGLEVLTVVDMNAAIFWDIASCRWLTPAAIGFLLG